MKVSFNFGIYGHKHRTHFLEAELLDEVCIAVTKEPMLLPLSGEMIRGNTAPGVWQPQERM